MSNEFIQLKNAHQNNLQNLNLQLPLKQLIVVTGVSGSGKSSLAFDTIYAEGQRRYVETFSPYARQFLDRMDRPKVDHISGIPPAIAIDQTNPVRTSRSTVGTMTELNDHLKLLFARLSSLHCQGCGKSVERDSPEQISGQLIKDHNAEQILMITFTVVIPESFTEQEIEGWLNRQGYTRTLHRDASSIEVIQDRVRLNNNNISRLNEALETAFRYGQGTLKVYPLDKDKQPGTALRYSAALQCADCNIHYDEPAPSLFSFNSPHGACEECRGFGRVMGIDYNLVIPNESLSLAGGAVKPWQTKTNQICQKDLISFAKKHKIPTQIPWSELTKKQQDWVINGVGEWDGDHWYGVQRFFDWLEGRAYKMHVRVLLSRYRSYTPCPVCLGARLKPQSLAWRIGNTGNADLVMPVEQRFKPQEFTLSAEQFKLQPGLCIYDLMRLPLSDSYDFFEALTLPAAIDEAGSLLLDEIRSRLRYLHTVGVGYLTLDRQSRTLSGGEVQRINLTTALGTSLVNTLFVLDEPSIGLHPQDMDRIVSVLHKLRDSGNSLIIVEHDPQLMLAADKIIDMGPGPGRLGGDIVFNGTPAQLLRSRLSLTADYLAGRKTLGFAQQKISPKNAKKITVKGASEHNLKNIDVSFPLGQLVCVCGISGSGKSTLVQDILYNALAKLKGNPAEVPGDFKKLLGHENIDEVFLVDQSAIGKSSRSNPISYTGGFESIRKVFATLPQSKERGYKAGSFSFNSGMKCPACSGNGFEHVEMQFLSDVYLSCPECKGSRYRPEVLEVKMFVNDNPLGKSIAEILAMTIDEALEFFVDYPEVIKAMQPMADVGLGYMSLGQPVPTLSGGEAQRLKLAAQLVKSNSRKPKQTKSGTTGHKLFLFDEPTTGLHFADIDKLLGAFQQLIDQGHSIIVIEHNLDIISNAQWLIELGHGGGNAGGQLVFSGTVDELNTRNDTATAKALKIYQQDIQSLRKQQMSPIGIEESQPNPYMAAAKNAISIHNAREHNLKNIDLLIPRDKFTVITGVSGSGKSTIAFDILFNEGQRRYLESLNAYARQFAQPSSRPEVDAIYGIPPTVAIEQRNSRGGLKSTVATLTEIYHFMRLLFVKLGTQYCPNCDIEIQAQSNEAIQAQFFKRWRGKKICLLAPMVVARKGYYTDLAKWAYKQGIEALLVDGEFLPTDEWPRLDRFNEHDIDLPVCEISIDSKQEAAVALQLQRALDYGKGIVKVAVIKNGKPDIKDMPLFSTSRSCPGCATSFSEADPRLFSYNSRHGWCESCFGTGQLLVNFDEEQSGEETNWKESEEHKIPCTECSGDRLNPTALSVRFRSMNIADYAKLSIQQAEKQFEKLKLKGREGQIAEDILSELQSRLRFLNEVGLSYLTLDRAAPTLSGGEAQRIRLAAQLGSNLQGVCYILDEPTIGLHPRDNQMLINTLRRLGDKGNTVLVVEHDEDTIRQADHVIDIGPSAGVRGGEVIATGTVKQLLNNPQSVTGQCLANPLKHPLYKPRGKDDKAIKITNAHANNLRNIDISIPLGKLVGISGVSGSGKSTLIREVLRKNLKILLNKPKSAKKVKFIGCDGIEDWQDISRVLEVDQTPVGKTPRSCPATYIGFWNAIRELFANTTEARIRGYQSNRFSFNVKDGRCDVCEGQGMRKIEMSFLPDVKVPCDRCNGARFNSETQSILYKGKSIGDVLNMDIDTAVEFFSAVPKIHKPLTLMQDVGLGYLTLGQQSPTLSGGEAQRIKLVTELAKRPNRMSKGNHTLYILDEPSVGLHMADVEKLIHVLHRLVDAGHSILLIEHNLDLLAEVDWLIDMGPEGGDAGGTIVSQGTVAKVIKSKRSKTAPYLQPLLN